MQFSSCLRFPDVKEMSAELSFRKFDDGVGFGFAVVRTGHGGGVMPLKLGGFWLAPPQRIPRNGRNNEIRVRLLGFTIEMASIESITYRESPADTESMDARMPVS